MPEHRQEEPPLQQNTLTLQQAKDQTRYWREAIEPLYGTNPDKMPHGFFIHMDDLYELVNLHKHLSTTEEIKGVRVYFAFDKPQTNHPHQDEDHHGHHHHHHHHLPDGIKGILVPVYLGIADMLQEEGIDPKYRDLIIPVKSFADGDEPEEKVTAYDVTQPCPPICDPESPLFGK